MRELTSHRVNGLNEALTITANDERGQGNANHYYEIRWADPESPECQALQGIHFQDGPLLSACPNGISNEALLAIVEDRLLGFQSGQFACRENAVALAWLQKAMAWLQKRTRDRVARGVEGTNQK